MKPPHRGHLHNVVDVSCPACTWPHPPAQENGVDCTDAFQAAINSAEPWWTWHWDHVRVPVSVNMIVTRWRRGSLLTIYRMLTLDDTQWWIYVPFNLGIGFCYPRRRS